MNNLMVVKKDGRREAFDRQKLLSGIQTACKKLPVSTEEIESIVNRIENETQNALKTEISSKDIGEMVMKALYKLNHVAYVRFSSVYQEFKDTRQFMAELAELQKGMSAKEKD
jgi:transcriptional repressor NrdR